MRKRGAIGSWSIFNSCGFTPPTSKEVCITKFILARSWALVGPAPGPSLPRGEPALLVSQAFSGRKGVVSQDYFHVECALVVTTPGQSETLTI